MRFHYRRVELEIRRLLYNSGQNCLVIINPATNERLTVLTVDVPDFDLPDGELAIRGWKNKDLLEVVYNTGLFDDTRKRGVVDKGDIEFWVIREPHRLTDISEESK